MDENNIRSLMEKLPEIIDLNTVYDLALKKIDVEEMAKAGELTVHEVGRKFATFGFIAGVDFALRNIVGHEEEKTE